MQWKSVPKYVRDSWRFLRRGRWHRALVADRLLGDLFISLWRRYRPDFASVGFNAGAHLQHHYMFASPLCKTALKNPEWWIAEGVDPVLESYRLYDEFLGDLQRADPEARIMLATGLSQEAHERVAHYYRLKDHEQVFQALGIPFGRIHPLMTEDFVVEYAGESDAREGERAIQEVKASSPDVFYVDTGDFANRGVETGPEIFFVDNRGSTLYVQLKPTARELPEGMAVSRGGRIVPDFPKVAAHAQLKNGHHNGQGYFADNQLKPGELPSELPLKQVFELVLRAFDLAPSVPSPASRSSAPASGLEQDVHAVAS